MSKDEWVNNPDNPRNKPKVSSERSQELYDEALAHGNKWDVQEKINARRLGDLRSVCGSGKISAPGKFDADTDWYALSTGAAHQRAQAVTSAGSPGKPLRPSQPRCQAGAGAFGTYFVHPSEVYGLKVFRDESFDADADWEFDRLSRAHAAGVNTPEPLAINRTKDGTQVLTLRHLKGYRNLGDVYGYAADVKTAPLITKIKLAREFRKLHVAGIAHGDMHSGNIMVNTRSNRVALVDFGYATFIDDSRHAIHSRDGVSNLLTELRRLPDFLGIERDFKDRTKGVLANLEAQARDYDRSWDKYELAVKRYHDALEIALLANDRLPRSRFVSGADQPRIPGLTRRILTANANTQQRRMMEHAHGRQNTLFEGAAKNLGVKPARLFLALKPERQRRHAIEQAALAAEVGRKLGTFF